MTYWTSAVKERWDICYYANRPQTFSGYTLCSVSLLTLTAISVDRLLALLLGLRYRQVVTLRRTFITVIALWILSIVSACTIFWNPLITSWYQYIGTALCLVTTIFAYAKIFLTLRHNQIHVDHVQSHVFPGQPSQAIPLNIARYRKAVNSALWVQVTLVVCYLPFGIAVALTPRRGMPLSSYLARNFAATIVYFNSSLNPLLYCWRIREVRQAVKETLRQLQSVDRVGLLCILQSWTKVLWTVLQHSYCSVFSRFSLKTVHYFRNLFAVLPPPTLYKAETRKKFWIHASNIVCGVRGEVGPV